jgi:hypothetical protein
MRPPSIAQSIAIIALVAAVLLILFVSMSGRPA